MAHRSSVHGVANRGMVVLTVVGILLVVGAYFALRSTAPNEKDRVSHPLGFSIVHPPGWEVDHFTIANDASSGSSIRLSPIKFVGKSPSMTVTRLPRPIDPAALTVDGYVKETFQGAPAWVRRRGSKPERRLFLSLDICLERSGEWFRVGLNLPGLEANREADYLPYLQSLRAEKPATTGQGLTPGASTAQSTTLPFSP